ncbi:MAG TPA: hemolysin III family protein, partial [Rudaea sp.]|nr:hemolysin III family protein [Rudaea sp.]
MSGERVAVRYSAGEEWANSVTHGVGIVLSVAGLAFLLFAARGTGGARELAACAVYGAALILVYTTSTLYHGVVHAPSKRVLRTVD